MPLCRYSPPCHFSLLHIPHSHFHTHTSRTRPPLVRVRVRIRICPRPLPFPIPHITCIVLAGPTGRHPRSLENPHMAAKKTSSHPLPDPDKLNAAHLCPSRFGYPCASSSDEPLRFRLPCPRSSPNCEGRTHSSSWHR